MSNTMNKNRILSAGFSTVTILLCGSCTTTQHNYQQPWPKTEIASKQVEKNLAVIEFDEQGDFWDKNQLRQSLEMIRSIDKPLLITYQHGWRHNAEPDDGDLNQFNQFIRNINKVKPAGYTACGIYIGWRGASISEKKGTGFFTTIPAILSFWDRKWATDRMADMGLSQTLSQTSEAVWNGQKKGRVVVMGHSFGGRIMEKTIAMSLASQAGNGASIKPVADLVVLINPASESLTARKMKMTLANWKKSYPLIVSLGSSNDRPNGIFWKWGYNLGPQAATRHYQLSNGMKDSQRDYLQSTVTNDPKQRTHELVDAKGDLPRPPKRNEVFARNLAQLSSTDKVSSKDPIWIVTDSKSPPKPYQLQQIDTRKVAGTPFVLDSKAYWVMQVPNEVLSGHSGDRDHGGIFCTSMTDLFAGIFARTELARRNSGGPTLAPSTSTELKIRSVEGLSNISQSPPSGGESQSHGESLNRTSLPHRQKPRRTP